MVAQNRNVSVIAVNDTTVISHRYAAYNLTTQPAHSLQAYVDSTGNRNTTGILVNDTISIPHENITEVPEQQTLLVMPSNMDGVFTVSFMNSDARYTNTLVCYVRSC